jgi:hypothetical protein
MASTRLDRAIVRRLSCVRSHNDTGDVDPIDHVGWRTC